MRAKKIFIAYLIFFLFLFGNCFASDSMAIRYLGIDQGLSNNAVTCIHKDHNGFMWFGTYDGLNKYDGYSFRVYRNIIGDSTSLLDNHIDVVNSDNENKIWVGGGRGLSVFDPIRAVFYTPAFINPGTGASMPLTDHVLSIKNIGKAMLVGTAHNGLIVFTNGNKTGRQIAFHIKSDPDISVPAIEYDSIRQQVWLFATGLGLFKYDSKAEKILQVATGITQCVSMFARSNGEVFVGNDLGIFKLDHNTFTRYGGFPELTVRDIVEDERHGLWIATDGNGLWYLPLHSDKAMPFTLQGESINSNSIYDLFIDGDGREWIGTLRGGINILEKNTNLFNIISYHSVLKDDVNDFILSFCEDDKANLWIGTDGAGLRYWNKQQNSFTKYVHSADSSSVSSNFITYMARDFKNDIWVSTWFGGINKLNKTNNTFKHYNLYNPYQKIIERNVWLMFEDSHKRLWASASNSGHLFLYNRNDDSFELFDNSIGDFQVLAEDHSGQLWGGNYNSLIQVDPENKKHKIYFIGFPVRSIHEGQDHQFWVGIEGGGLLLFDRSMGVYQRRTTQDGLPNNAILRILEDKHQNLWLSTYYGLCRYNPGLKTFRNFTQADGLQSNQFSFNAAMISSTGAFLFGGIKGFNIFSPDSINDRKNIPRLFLTGLKIDNSPVEQQIKYITGHNNNIITEITVPFKKAILSIDFTALQFSNSSNLKYAYFLSGLDKDWEIANNVRTAIYSQLKEGNYSFYVKVMNANGVWNEKVRLLNIVILPPWYRTWWAYLLAAAFLVASVYIILYYYLRQERLRYEIRLALLEKEKETELSERKIAFFTHISHEFRTPLTLIINPIKELAAEIKTEQWHKKLVTVQRNAMRLLSLVNQLLLFRKAASIDEQLRMQLFDLNETCNNVFQNFTQLAASKHINFIINRPEDELLFCGDKEKIEIILFNLLSNALKYTPVKGKVVLSIARGAETISITVSDTGCGIAANIDNRIFDPFYQANNEARASQAGFGIGLYVSKKLALAHKGTLLYTSKDGEGTSFTLTLPRPSINAFEQVASDTNSSRESIMHELVEDIQGNDLLADDKQELNKSNVIDKIVSGLPSMVIVDDNTELRNYIKDIFCSQFNIYEAEDGIPAFDLICKEMPDIVISDLVMKKMDGIELCRRVKANPALAHIPLILLTGSSSEQSKIKGIECGAEDYLNKPFSKELIVARVQNILQSRNRLQQYFFNTVTLQPATGIDGENKDFLDRCIEIVEMHLDNPEFSVQAFCKEIGMSHPALYKKIKAVSGLTVNVFIRYLRLRKAAELLINTSKTIVEVTYITGFNDIKYFREQFSKLFGLTPSDYVKRYRKPFGNKILKKDS
jgi:signal transduction histidine kinase/ligand-binding sensor domain-containing protein/DNA-binding response OmpR family regulator